MLQVMLVDDKKSIVDGLEVYIDWNSLGYEVAAKATGAIEAIEIAKKQHIDLIITDIRMPDMTGLEMIAELGKSNLTCKYIFLSGYSEFEYAKWAIENRVSGYLLKPVNADELTELLTKIKKEIEEEAAFLNQKTTEYLRRILDGGSVTLAEHTVLSESRRLRYILVKEFRRDVLSGRTDDGRQTDAIAETIKRFSGKEGKCFVVEGPRGEVELVVDCEKCREGITQYVQNLKLWLNTGGIPGFVILVGSAAGGIEEIRSSKESVTLLEKVVFYESARSIFFHEDYEAVAFSDDVSDMPMDQALEAVRNVNEEMFRQGIEAFRSHINQRKVSPDIVMGCVNKLVFDISDYISKNGGDIMQIMFRWSIIKKASNLTCDLICGFLLELWEKAYAEIQKTGKRQTFAIDDIIAYIQENYGNEKLSLQEIAKKYYISSAYLGKLFTEKTGESFRVYLLRIRIEKAKNLLAKSNYAVYKIAHMVGFSDANYFNIKFQKSEGVTPARYRELYGESRDGQT